MRALAQLIRLRKKQAPPAWIAGTGFGDAIEDLVAGRTRRVPPILIDDLVDEKPDWDLPMHLPWDVCCFDYYAKDAGGGVHVLCLAGKNGPWLPSNRKPVIGERLSCLFVIFPDRRPQAGLLGLDFYMSEEPDGARSLEFEIVEADMTEEERRALKGDHVRWANTCTYLLQQDERKQSNHVYRMVAPIMCALQRLACANVEAVVWRKPGTRIKRKRKVRGLAYRVLCVRSGDGRLRPLAPRRQSTDDEKTVRFHMRRGHYRDYRKGRGLFGRTKKLVWVQPHACGDKALGEIRKAYKVEKSEESA